MSKGLHMKTMYSALRAFSSGLAPSTGLESKFRRFLSAPIKPKISMVKTNRMTARAAPAGTLPTIITCW